MPREAHAEIQIQAPAFVDILLRYIVEMEPQIFITYRTRRPLIFDHLSALRPMRPSPIAPDIPGLTAVMR